MFICVKYNIACSELWVDDDFKILAIEVKGSDPSYTWEIIGTYRAPNEDVRIIERLAARTGFLGISIKRSIIGGDLNLPQVNWKGIANSSSAAQTFIQVGVGLRVHTGSGKTDPRGFFTGCIPCATRLHTYIL